MADNGINFPSMQLLMSARSSDGRQTIAVASDVLATSSVRSSIHHLSATFAFGDNEEFEQSVRLCHHLQIKSLLRAAAVGVLWRLR